MRGAAGALPDLTTVDAELVSAGPARVVGFTRPHEAGRRSPVRPGQHGVPTGSTGVKTSAQAGVEVGKGVCQDIAHLTVGMLRELGLPARYVCGYLHPKPKAEPSGSRSAGREPRLGGVVGRRLERVRPDELRRGSAPGTSASAAGATTATSRSSRGCSPVPESEGHTVTVEVTRLALSAEAYREPPAASARATSGAQLRSVAMPPASPVSSRPTPRPDASAVTLTHLDQPAARPPAQLAHVRRPSTALRRSPRTASPACRRGNSSPRKATSDADGMSLVAWAISANHSGRPGSARPGEASRRTIRPSHGAVADVDQPAGGAATSGIDRR